MALDSYSDLKTSVSNWIARADLDPLVPDFISLAEDRIYREVRVRAMETALSDTISAGVISVPTGYLELKHAYIDGDAVQWLTRKDPEWIYAKYPVRSSDGVPSFIAREGSNFIFGQYPDSSYTVKGIYYKKLDPLSDSNTSNWLITDAPDLILFGALVEAHLYIKDQGEADRWNARFVGVKDMVMREDKRESFSGSVISVSAG